VTGRARDRRTVVSVAFYALFLFTAQFEHHDLLCHLKTPQHCSACTSSIVGAGTDAVAAPGTTHLVDAGRAICVEHLVGGVLLPVRTTGRSPPLPL
jgi:hypothetical protein